MLNADKTEFEFTSDFDELKVSALIAKPTGDINGIVQIVHGMYEHKELYFDFMDYLAGEGFTTVIHDNRGHGKSICSEDDLGFMFRNGDKGFAEDIFQLKTLVRKANPDIPYFIIGNDIGSLGVRCMLKEHDSDICGVIVLGCPCYSMFSGFYRAISSEYGGESRERNKRIAEAMEKTFGKGFDGSKRAWISSQKETVEQFLSDPLSNFDYTLNGYECILRMIKETYSKSGWQVSDPSLPIRFISGRDDPFMLSEAKFMKALNLLDRVGYGSISHRLFDGMRHNVLFEKNNINVYKDIAKTIYSWLDRQAQ